MQISKIILCLFLIIVVVVYTDFGIFNKFFSNDETVAENVKTTLHDTYEKYQKAKNEISDYSNAAWDNLYERYDDAWNSYQETKTEATQASQSAFQTLMEDYEKAKNSLKEYSQKATDFFDQYKDKAEEKATETYYLSLKSLEEYGEMARKKYLEVFHALRKKYDDTYEATQEDYSMAAEYLSDAMNNLKNYAQKKSDESSQITTKRLEEAKERAQENLNSAKERYLETKKKIETFDKEISEQLQTNYESLKQRAEDILNVINSYGQKWIEGDINQNERKRLQEIKDRIFQEYTETEQVLTSMREKLSKSTIDTLEALKQKYGSMKDEL